MGINLDLFDNEQNSKLRLQLNIKTKSTAWSISPILRLLYLNNVKIAKITHKKCI